MHSLETVLDSVASSSELRAVEFDKPLVNQKNRNKMNGVGNCNGSQDDKITMELHHWLPAAESKATPNVQTAQYSNVFLTPQKLSVRTSRGA